MPPAVYLQKFHCWLHTALLRTEIEEIPYDVVPVAAQEEMQSLEDVYKQVTQTEVHIKAIEVFVDLTNVSMIEHQAMVVAKMSLIAAVRNDKDFGWRSSSR